MAPVILTILVVWVTTIRSIQTNDECDEKYTNITEEHTMCKSINEDCNFIRHKGKVFAEQLLRTHNLIRNSIRKYVGEKYNLPTNMKLMYWDDELYEMARIHTLQCVEEPDCDLCHQIGDFPVEQNFAVKTYKMSEVDNNGPVRRFQTVIKEWATELKLYDPSIVSSMEITDDLPTNWTNIMRANASFVGCASMNYYTDKEAGIFNEVYTCNYGPANLTEGEEIYKTGGKPCSECEDDGVCDKEFKRLCVLAGLEFNITVGSEEEEETIIEIWPGMENYTETNLNEETEETITPETSTVEETENSLGEETSSIEFTETLPEETSVNEFKESVVEGVVKKANSRRRKSHPSVLRMLTYINRRRRKIQH